MPALHPARNTNICNYFDKKVSVYPVITIALSRYLERKTCAVRQKEAIQDHDRYFNQLFIPVTILIPLPNHNQSTHGTWQSSQQTATCMPVVLQTFYERGTPSPACPVPYQGEAVCLHGMQKGIW